MSGSESELKIALRMDQNSLDRQLQRFQQEQSIDVTDCPQDVRSLLDCLHQSLFQPELNVGVLKAKCQIRDNNITSRFRLATGLTIKQYIESMRMKAAGMLLRKERSAVLDIAQAIGYYYPQAFYRAFQKHFHCTPAEYRERVEA